MTSPNHGLGEPKTRDIPHFRSRSRMRRFAHAADGADRRRPRGLPWLRPPAARGRRFRGRRRGRGRGVGARGGRGARGLRSCCWTSSCRIRTGSRSRSESQRAAPGPSSFSRRAARQPTSARGSTGAARTASSTRTTSRAQRSQALRGLPDEPPPPPRPGSGVGRDHRLPRQRSCSSLTTSSRTGGRRRALARSCWTGSGSRPGSWPGSDVRETVSDCSWWRPGSPISRASCTGTRRCRTSSSRRWRACRFRSSFTSSLHSRAVGSRQASSDGSSPSSMAPGSSFFRSRSSSGTAVRSRTTARAVPRTRFSSWTPTPSREPCRRQWTCSSSACWRSPSCCSSVRYAGRARRPAARSTPCS